MKLSLALLLLAGLARAEAPKPLRLTGGPKAEDKLRRFVTQDRALRARFDEAARREETVRAEMRESGLKDAVADAPSVEPREELIARLPGLKEAPLPNCPSLRACPVPELATEVADAELLPDAVRRLVRPWMLLQQARGSALELAPADANETDALLTVRLRDMDSVPLVLNAAPRLVGGFKVWFDSPLALASLYERERAAALKQP